MNFTSPLEMLGGNILGSAGNSLPGGLGVLVNAVVVGAIAVAFAAGWAGGGTTSAAVHNPFAVHGANTASVDAGNIAQDGVAGSADAVNGLQIPGVYIPVQRP